MATRLEVNLKTGEVQEVTLTPAEETAAANARAAEQAYLQSPAGVRKSTDESERQSCAVDPAILPLVNQTKAEWLTWAGNNFPSLTAAEKTRLGMLFWVVSVGVRRAIRAGA